jgi:glycine/D-amino acid oxidase-like deaminating enzyme
MRVAVIGAGVFGVWCAKFLADAGHAITIVDAYGPANARASSSDHSRVIRAGYGRDAIYSEWATQSLRDWQWLADVTQRTLFARTGALFLGRPEDEYVRDTHATLRDLGIQVECLDQADVAERFQQIDADGLGAAAYEPQAGVIRARAAVQALMAYVIAGQRVSYLQARVRAVDEHGSGPGVHTVDGRRLEADAFVFACGPWLRQVFPIAVGERLRVTRQEVLWFGTPAGDVRFSAARMPVWIDFTAGFYGIPDLDAAGFKVGIDRHGAPIDPDSHDRLVPLEIVEKTRQWVGRRFPGLSGAPLLDAHVCQYENTSSGDFIIDRHPACESWWLVGGGSGHGFKHGPAVGRHVAELIDGRTAVQRRFSLDSKTSAAARAVY